MVHSGGYKSPTPAALRLSLSSLLSSSSSSSSKMGMKRVDLIRCAFKASDVDVDVVDVIGVIGVVDVLEDSFLPFSQNEKKETLAGQEKNLKTENCSNTPRLKFGQNLILFRYFFNFSN